MADTRNLIGRDIVITEKLDGSNVLLHQGQVYARSTAGGPAASHPWLAMTRKHHAHKTMPHGWRWLLLYGEDLYGVHSIEYDPMPERQTLRIFASAHVRGWFHSWEQTKDLARQLRISTVPELFTGVVHSPESLTETLLEMHRQSSALGGQREGLIVRNAGQFRIDELHLNVCKSVRPDHVQTEEHWTRNWRSCRIIKDEQ